MLKNKEDFIEGLTRLFTLYSDDNNHGVEWVGNEFIKFYEHKFNVKIDIRFDEINNNFNDVIECIKKT